MAIRTVTYESNKRTADALSINAGLAAKQAVELLAKSAACEERLDDDSHNENVLYFLVRSLCNEHGLNYEEIVAKARHWARLF